MTKQRAVAELLLAGGLWGFGFVATVWALQALTPSELLIGRALIAVIVAELLWLVFLRRKSTTDWRTDLKLALPAGLLLAAFSLPQTIGLQYTTATKSGFLTTLYVILVPLMNHAIFRARTKTHIYGFALMALVGAFLLMDADLSELNPGDLWTLLCAVMAAAHIIYIGRVSRLIGDSFRFNTFQTFWSLLFVLPLYFFQSEYEIRFETWHPLAGLLFMALFSSVVAFSIQVRSQKVLLPTTASMLFLLESPFALLFGWALLNERLTLVPAAGAAMILVAAALTVKYE